MITAREAIESSEKERKKLLKPIEKQIKQATKYGYRHTSYELIHQSSETIQYIMSFLRELGYRVDKEESNCCYAYITLQIEW